MMDLEHLEFWSTGNQRHGLFIFRQFIVLDNVTGCISS